MMEDLERGRMKPPVEVLYSYPSRGKKHDKENKPKNQKSKSNRSGFSTSVHWLDEKEQGAVTKALGRRAYHLPTNKTWCEDWRQWMSNNHPLWGLFCFHSSSPLGWGQRCLGPLISIFIGYSATIITLWLSVTFIPALDESVIAINMSNDSSARITWAQIFLWTWIGGIHAFHDVAIWPLFYNTNAGSLVWLMFWIGVALTFSGVMIGENNKHASSKTEKDDDLIHGAVDMAWYSAVEIGCSWLLWYPLIGTIMFSGILGCFRLPFLGGQPREVYLEKTLKKAEQQQNNANRTRLRSRSMDSNDLAQMCEVTTVAVDDEVLEGPPRNIISTTNNNTMRPKKLRHLGGGGYPHPYANHRKTLPPPKSRLDDMVMNRNRMESRSMDTMAFAQMCEVSTITPFEGQYDVPNSNTRLGQQSQLYHPAHERTIPPQYHHHSHHHQHVPVSQVHIQATINNRDRMQSLSMDSLTIDQMCEVSTIHPSEAGDYEVPRTSTTTRHEQEHFHPANDIALLQRRPQLAIDMERDRVKSLSMDSAEFAQMLNEVSTVPGVSPPNSPPRTMRPSQLGRQAAAGSASASGSKGSKSDYNSSHDPPRILQTPSVTDDDTKDDEDVTVEIMNKSDNEGFDVEITSNYRHEDFDVEITSHSRNEDFNVEMRSYPRNEDFNVEITSHSRNDDDFDVESMNNSRNEDFDVESMNNSRNEDFDVESMSHARNEDYDVESMSHSRNDESMSVQRL